MKIPSLSAALVATLAAFTLSGCAVMTKSRKQEVVVRSSPAGALTKINGTEVGVTPLRVKLSRDEVFRVDVEKNGFAPESAIILPTAEEYNQRYLRWGVDYDLGVAPDLIPGELLVEMKPAMGDVVEADAYVAMSAQIVRADAMLASGELTPADHKYLVQRIISTYSRQ
jgi:hypothetical protein